MSIYRRPNTSHYWVKFKVDGRLVRLSTGTENIREAREF